MFPNAWSPLVIFREGFCIRYIDALCINCTTCVPLCIIRTYFTSKEWFYETPRGIYKCCLF